MEGEKGSHLSALNNLMSKKTTHHSTKRWRFIFKIFMCHYFISSSLHVDKEIGI